MTTSIPFLSSELLELIILEARRDLPTLSSCARVSLLFLELTGPLLYEDVEITREDQYRNLFSDRVSDCFPAHVLLVPTKGPVELIFTRLLRLGV